MTEANREWIIQRCLNAFRDEYEDWRDCNAHAHGRDGGWVEHADSFDNADR